MAKILTGLPAPRPILHLLPSLSLVMGRTSDTNTRCHLLSSRHSCATRYIMANLSTEAHPTLLLRRSAGHTFALAFILCMATLVTRYSAHYYRCLALVLYQSPRALSLLHLVSHSGPSSPKDTALDSPAGSARLHRLFRRFSVCSREWIIHPADPSPTAHYHPSFANDACPEGLQLTTEEE